MHQLFKRTFVILLITIMVLVGDTIPNHRAISSKYSGYGWGDISPFDKKPHWALDYGAPEGTDIYAMGDGIVSDIYWNYGGGNCFIVDHGYINGKRVESKYVHCSKILVKKRQRVTKGQVIALVGNTGEWTTGPHLHLELKVGGVIVHPDYYRSSSKVARATDPYAGLTRGEAIVKKVTDEAIAEWRARERRASKYLPEDYDECLRMWGM